MRILVIEDELPLASSMASTLMRSGHSLSSERDSASGLRHALARRHDLVVLDLKTLKGPRAGEQLRRACARSRVLMLTERSEVAPQFNCPRSGTSDFLTKPFAMGELVTRVEALGRHAPPITGFRWRVADLSLDSRSRQVARAGKTIKLRNREFTLLEILLREPGRTFSRAELSERIWHREHRYGSRTVEMSISRLRRHVDFGFDVPLIHTVQATGYTLRAPA